MSDETKSELVAEVMAAFGQIWDELASHNKARTSNTRQDVKISSEHALTLATWCVAAKDPESVAFQNPPVFGKQPTRVPVPVATPRSR